MGTRTWTAWLPGPEGPMPSPSLGVYTPGTRIWDIVFSRQAWLRATSPKPQGKIPKKDGGVRIIQNYGKSTPIGQEAHEIAGIVGPFLVRFATNLAARTGVIWSHNMKAPEAILAHIINNAPRVYAADLAKAFWQVRKRDVYRLLRRAGLPRVVAAFLAWQMTDDQKDGQKVLRQRLSMGHPLSPILLALWILTNGRNFFKKVQEAGGLISIYADNIQISGIPFPKLISLQGAAGRLRWKKSKDGRAWKTLVPGAPPEMGVAWVPGGTPYSRFWAQPAHRKSREKRAIRILAKVLAWGTLGGYATQWAGRALQVARGLAEYNRSVLKWGRARYPRHRLPQPRKPSDPRGKPLGGRPVRRKPRSARLRRRSA